MDTQKNIDLITSILNEKKKDYKSKTLSNIKKETNKYLKKEMSIILAESCSNNFKEYKYLRLLPQKEHGVIGLPVNILLNNNTHIYLKVSFYSDIIKYTINDIKNPGFIEYIITKKLYKLVESNITPHLIRPIKLYNCKKKIFLNYLKNLQIDKSDDKIKDLRYIYSISNYKSVDTGLSVYKKMREKINEDNEKENIINYYDAKMHRWLVSEYLSFIELEWLDGDTLYSYLCKLLDSNKILSNGNVLNKIMVIYFQILYSLISINKHYNKFQHNDLHFKNIMITAIDNMNKLKYDKYILNNIDYYIPQKYNINVKIFDFDKSNINNIENTRVIHKFKNTIYNYVDNNYDVIYIIAGLYRLIFQKYFYLINKIIENTNGKSLKFSILNLENKVKQDFSNDDSYLEIYNLNKNFDIIVIKIVYIIKDINKKYTKDDLYDLIKFMDGNKSKLKNISEILKIINIYRDIIKELSKTINYIPFVYLYLNGKLSQLLKNHFEDQESRINYTSIIYIQKILEQLGNIQLNIKNNRTLYIDTLKEYLSILSYDLNDKFKNQLDYIFNNSYRDILKFDKLILKDLKNTKIFIEEHMDSIFKKFKNKKDNIKNIYNSNNKLI